MPCYDGRENEPRIIYRDGVDPEPLNNRISSLENSNKWLEAGLCAIITELEKRNIASEVITEASKKGLINLVEFWEYHKKDDLSRLTKELEKFSEHEQEMLRQILNKQK